MIETTFMDSFPNAAEEAYFRKLIVENLPFIEKQCHKACAKYQKSPSSHTDPSEINNESFQIVTFEIDHETLVNLVMDRLTGDNYRVLKNYKGKSKITTYIRTIISNIVVDLLRKQKGRNRAKERAKGMGPFGEALFELVLEKGYPAEEAYEYLKKSYDIQLSLGEIEEKIETLKRLVEGYSEAEPLEGRPFVTESDPEKELLRKDKDRLIQRVLDQILSGLSDEDKFMIRMRFPLSEEESPRGIPEIARILGLSKKAVDSRIRRILAKCKEMILKHGLAVEDLIEA